MIDCALHGRLDDGRRHAESLLPLVRALFAEPSPTVIKATLHAAGRISTPHVRPPHLDASSTALQRAKRALTAASKALEAS